MLVYVPADFPWTAEVFPPARALTYAQTPSPKEADILRRSDRDNVIVEAHTGTKAKCHHETRFPLKSGPRHLPNVMDGIVHFNYCLDVSAEATPRFGLEIHRLRGEQTQRKPDLAFDQDGNMVADGVVRFQSDVGAMYGFTIRNMSDVAVFPHLFYFDPDTFTIQQWYEPSRTALPPGGTVNIGMGAERAFEFALEPGQQESSGFLKLFVTCHRLDLAWMRQEISPFHPDFPEVLEATGRAGVERSTTPLQWDALTVTLTMTEH
ncbi:hypothetical protein C8R47DRAFT_1169140 [Mycena vitilis]|nr:hypothetical protein C8R47DRAFT_1169140 [Mycena vitilis]